MACALRSYPINLLESIPKPPILILETGKLGRMPLAIFALGDPTPLSLGLLYSI